MFQSFRLSQVALRIGLTLMFLWLGIGKFVQPQEWLATRVPHRLATISGALHVGTTDLLFLTGILEILIAASLATGFFMRWFAAGGAALLLVAGVFQGSADGAIQNIGLIGGLVSIVLWPERQYS